LTTAKSVLNISFVSSFKRQQIDKDPDPPFPISFSILKSNPKFNIKNAGKLSSSFFYCYFLLNQINIFFLKKKEMLKNQGQCLTLCFDQ